MSGGIKTLVGVILVLIGALLLWPEAHAYWRYSLTNGEIMAAFTEPAGPQGVRLRVWFEFSVAEHGGKTEYFGSHQADSRFRIVDDPVLSIKDAERLTRHMQGEDARAHRSCRVFYDPADPADSAFIVSEAVEKPTKRYQVGLGMVVIGILLTLFVRRRAQVHR